MSDITVPGVGPVKKQYVIAGVGIVAVIVGVSYMRRSKAKAADAATPADTSATAADTSPYTQASDAAGYNTVYPSVYPQQSQYGYDYMGNPIPSPTGLGSNGVYTTNNDWTVAAETALAETGVTTQASALAISRVLGNLSVTTTQQGYFMQAIGRLGQPPQGYPKPIHVVDPTPAPAPGGGHSGAPHAPANVHAQRVDRTGISLAWNSVAAAKGYVVYLDGHQLQTVTYTHEYVHDLKPHTTHTLSVATLGTNGKLSPKTTIHVKTHK